MSDTKLVSCIITPAHPGDMLAKPPLMLNGKKYAYEFGKQIKLPENVVEVAQGVDTLNVEIIDDTATESPADVLTHDDGNGDGAAASQGGTDAGGADAPTDPAPEAQAAAEKAPAKRK